MWLLFLSLFTCDSVCNLSVNYICSNVCSIQQIFEKYEIHCIKIQTFIIELIKKPILFNVLYHKSIE